MIMGHRERKKDNKINKLQMKVAWWSILEKDYRFIENNPNVHHYNSAAKSACSRVVSTASSSRLCFNSFTSSNLRACCASLIYPSTSICCSWNACSCSCNSCTLDDDADPLILFDPFLFSAGLRILGNIWRGNMFCCKYILAAVQTLLWRRRKADELAGSVLILLANASNSAKLSSRDLRIFPARWNVSLDCFEIFSLLEQLVTNHVQIQRATA